MNIRLYENMTTESFVSQVNLGLVSCYKFIVKIAMIFLNFIDVFIIKIMMIRVTVFVYLFECIECLQTTEKVTYFAVQRTAG